MKIAALAIGAALILGGFAIEAQAQCCGEKKVKSEISIQKEIDSTLYIDINGKRIFTCCKDCLDKIKADPAKFVKEIEEGGVKFDSLENCQYYVEKSPDSAKWEYKSLHKIITPLEMTLKDTTPDNLPKVQTESTQKVISASSKKIVSLSRPKIIDPSTPKVEGKTREHIVPKE